MIDGNKLPLSYTTNTVQLYLHMFNINIIWTIINIMIWI